MRTKIISTGLFCAAILALHSVAFAEAKTMPSGVSGIVSLSPGCPGPQLKDQPCIKPLVGKEVQLMNKAGKVIGQATTTDEGKFAINAKHGKYVLKAVVDAAYPRCQPVEVTIKRHSMTTTNMACDSGMR